MLQYFVFGVKGLSDLPEALVFKKKKLHNYMMIIWKYVCSWNVMG